MRFEQLDMNKLRESEDMVVIYNTKLVIWFWNATLQNRYNITAEEAEGKNLLELFPYIKNDYRVHCLLECGESGKSFFFNNMPFEYAKGFYSQLIVPLKDNQENLFGVLNIIRTHKKDNEVHTRKSLLIPLLTDESVIQELLA